MRRKRIRVAVREMCLWNYRVVGRTPNRSLIASLVCNGGTLRLWRSINKVQNRPRYNDCSAKLRGPPSSECANQRVYDYLLKANHSVIYECPVYKIKILAYNFYPSKSMKQQNTKGEVDLASHRDISEEPVEDGKRVWTNA